MNYKFSLKDLPKYSSRLKSRDLDERFLKTAMGKRVPTLAERIRMLEKNQTLIKELQHWEHLKNLALIQQADWSKSKIYSHYEEHGKQRIHNANIYSETEIHYYITMLKKMIKKKYSEDLPKEELKK